MRSGRRAAICPTYSCQGCRSSPRKCLHIARQARFLMRWAARRGSSKSNDRPAAARSAVAKRSAVANQRRYEPARACPCSSASAAMNTSASVLQQRYERQVDARPENRARSPAPACRKQRPSAGGGASRTSSFVRVAREVEKWKLQLKFTLGARQSHDSWAMKR